LPLFQRMTARTGPKMIPSLILAHDCESDIICQLMLAVAEDRPQS
jgi:hypothetical protein